MTTRTTIPDFQDHNFLNSKIVRFIETLRRIQFSGQLQWADPNDQRQWTFYFHSGHLFYATGGVHPVRRWVRNLADYCPQFQLDIPQLQRDLSKIRPDNATLSWEYHLVCLWIQQNKLTLEQASQIIQSILSEVLFELSQFPDATHQIHKYQSVPEQLVLVDEARSFLDVQELWQSLLSWDIDGSCLDQAPIIRHPDRLQQQALTGEVQALIQLLDGKRTLRDLALRLRQNVVQVAHSLLPYVQSGLIEFVSIVDLPAPDYLPAKNRAKQRTDVIAKPLVACVDDSSIVCWTMEQLLTEAGYRFVAVSDGFRAVTTLLSCKPDLIFLDVFMLNTNGYEICKTLRRAPSFKNTPIVFLTGFDGVVDQVRAKLAGASDFLSKPIDAKRVLDTVAQHLPQGTTVR